MVGWTPDNQSTTYMASIDIAEKRSIGSIITNDVFPISLKLCRQRMKAWIQTNELKQISLLCPLTNERMVLPGRSTSCDHIECFDITTYLTVNQTEWTWRCPICQEPALPHQLDIDGLFKSLLRMKSLDTKSIALVKTLKWSKVATLVKH